MDRRRFVPSSEGLEGRALLSLFGHSSTNKTVVNVDDLPLTFTEKAARIKRVPYYLDQLQPGRFLPPAAITDLQANLYTIAGTVPHSPPPAILNEFNHNIREVTPLASLSVRNAEILSRSFGAVLDRTGMSPDLVSALKADMNAIAKVDSQSRQPVYLATNDYAIVLQDTLAIGRPIARPGIPEVALHNGLRVKTGINVTYFHRPDLVGSYNPPQQGVLSSPVGTTIQVIDEAGNVLGTANVPSSGKYVLPITTPLPEGTNVLRVRAVDQQGLVSNPSQNFVIRVIPPRVRAQELITGVPTPKGPAGSF